MSGEPEAVLDRDIAAWLDTSGPGLDWTTASVREIRSALVQIAALSPAQPGPVAATDLRWSADGHELGGVLHRPTGAQLPLLVFLHGGGFIAGSPDTIAGPAACLARRAGVAVFVPEYPLAPERPYPHAVDHLTALMGSLDDSPLGSLTRVDQLGLGGESAGGHLALAVAAALAAAGCPPLRLLALLYPMVARRTRRPSYRRYADGPVLTAAAIQRFWHSYDPHHSSPDPTVMLTKHPQAAAHVVLAACELDPLSCDCRQLARDLERAGSQTTLLEWRGTCHGSWLLDQVSPVARAYNQDFAELVHRRLHEH